MNSTYRMIHRAPILTGAIALIGHAALSPHVFAAQPSRKLPSGVLEATVPAAVYAMRDGTAKVVTTTVQGPSLDELQRLRPLDVPVFSELRGGEMRPGIWFTNYSDRPASTVIAFSPVPVTMDPFGQYRSRCEWLTTQICRTTTGAHGVFPANFEQLANSTSSVRVYYETPVWAEKIHSEAENDRQAVAAPADPPQPATDPAPPKGSVGIDTDPTLGWQGDSSAVAHDVYLFRGMQTEDAFEIFQAQDLLTFSVSVPAGLLRPGRTYSWFITSLSAYEYSFSDTFFFTTAGCSADWDRSGAVTSSDVSVFLSQWFNDLDQHTTEADFNDDGVITSVDVSDFLNAWLAQTGACP